MKKKKGELTPSILCNCELIESEKPPKFKCNNCGHESNSFNASVCNTLNEYKEMGFAMCCKCENCKINVIVNPNAFNLFPVK